LAALDRPTIWCARGAPSPVPGETLSSAEVPPSAPAPESGAQPVSADDDTMSWLESLASTEGVASEELPSAPTQRSETLPDKAQTETWEPAASETPQEDVSITSWLSKLEIEEAKSKAQAAPVEPQPETLPSTELPDWLKELDKPAASEQPSKPAEDLPEWLRQPAPSTTPDHIPVPTSPLEKEVPAWIDEKVTSFEPAVSDQTPVPEDGIPAWIDETAPAPGTDVPAPTEQPEKGMSAWIDNAGPTAEPPASVTPPVPEKGMSAWVDETNPSDKPSAPVVPEPEMPAWIDEAVPVAGTPAPTTPEEWVPVDEKPAPVTNLEPAAPAVVLPAQPQVQPTPPLKGTGMLSRVPLLDKDAELLAGAQAALDANKLNEAMLAYSKLIKKNHLLDEVIHDLREAIYRFPVDIIVWQTLGDACMRANRLQDALDAYTKAEELLR
jgi:hypothetical protein